MASTTTADTHRQGWRTGIALIASGRSPVCDPGAGGPEAMSVTSTYCGTQYDGTQVAPIELLLLSVTSVLAMAPSVTFQFLRMLL
jgi:hypothetical protein